MPDRTSADNTPPHVGFFTGPLQKHGPAPATVWIAFWLLIAGAALTVAELVIRVVSTGWTTNGSVRGAVLAALVLGAVGVALRVYVSLAVLRGYSPARMYLIVVAVLVLIPEFVGGFNVIYALYIASIAASIVLVWLPVSGRYFDSATAPRKGDTSR